MVQGITALYIVHPPALVQRAMESGKLFAFFSHVGKVNDGLGC